MKRGLHILVPFFEGEIIINYSKDFQARFVIDNNNKIVLLPNN